MAFNQISRARNVLAEPSRSIGKLSPPGPPALDVVIVKILQIIDEVIELLDGEKRRLAAKKKAKPRSRASA